MRAHSITPTDPVAAVVAALLDLADRSSGSDLDDITSGLAAIGRIQDLTEVLARERPRRQGVSARIVELAARRMGYRDPSRNLHGEIAIGGYSSL